MKAKIAHRYSDLDKHHEYFVEADNVWTWFAMGKRLPASWDDVALYPYVPNWLDLKIKEIEARDATVLGRKITVQLIKWKTSDENKLKKSR
jgi:hypothetical protein